MDWQSAHLRTFAAGSRGYRLAAQRLARSAAKSGLFGDTAVWSAQDLARGAATLPRDLAFIAAHSRGYGLWLWKPLLLLQELERLRDGTHLLYLDAGCELNLSRPKPRSRLAEYWELAGSQGLAGFDTGLAAIDWTKPAVFGALGISAPDRSVTQVGAGGLFMTVGEDSRRVVREWLRLCRFGDGVLLTDEAPADEVWTSSPNLNHRHDQALFSIVYRQFGLTALPQEFWFGGSVREWRRNGADYPVWASRSSRGIPMFGTTPASALIVYPREAARRLRAWSRRSGA